MSKLVVNLEENTDSNVQSAEPEFGVYQEPKRRSVFSKVLAGLFIAAILLGVVAVTAGFFYWRYLKTTPQYSLALVVDAARRDDQDAMDKLIDTDSVVEDFAPQIIDKAIELYGRGVAPPVLKRVMKIAAPALSVVKKRVKAELPGLIRDKTERFEKIPFWAMAVGADRYLDIRQEDGKAFIKSKVPSRSFEIEMKRNGDIWQIVAVKDEKLAQKIANKVGQEIIGLAKKGAKGTIDDLGERIGIKNLGDIFNRLRKKKNK